VFLVDTSVWIDFLRAVDHPSVAKLDEILAQGAHFGITSMIYQEILQGTDSDVSFTRLERYLGSQRFYHPRHPLRSHVDAARLFFRCRRAGVTIRSAVDCLIAQVAIEHGLELLHNDRDFTLMAEAIPELKIC
jgi:predicted nucleic acid-binding protein